MLRLSIYSAGCGDGARDTYCDEDGRWKRVAKRLSIQMGGSIDSSGGIEQSLAAMDFTIQ